MTTLLPDSPCTAKVVPGDNGGMLIELQVPTYNGGVTLKLEAERQKDGDWIVYIPWLDGLDENRVYHLEGDVGDVSNGIVYLGAPDVPLEATWP